MNQQRGTSRVSETLKIPSHATSASAAAATIIVSRASKSTASTRGDKNVENAIYAHLRALRALGKKQVNTAEIAEALGLGLSTVHRAIASLTKKGVKVL
jgi:hypothetical protein